MMRMMRNGLSNWWCLSLGEYTVRDFALIEPQSFYDERWSTVKIVLIGYKCCNQSLVHRESRGFGFVVRSSGDPMGPLALSGLDLLCTGIGSGCRWGLFLRKWWKGEQKSSCTIIQLLWWWRHTNFLLYFISAICREERGRRRRPTTKNTFVWLVGSSASFVFVPHFSSISSPRSKAHRRTCRFRNHNQTSQLTAKKKTWKFL